MAEEKIGLESNEIRLKKRDDELISAIMKARTFSEDRLELVSDMMRYNMWTVPQFCDITGYNASTISNFARPNYNKEGQLVTELDFCYPFKSLEGNGPKFIIRNEKSEKKLPKVG